MEELDTIFNKIESTRYEDYNMDTNLDLTTFALGIGGDEKSYSARLLFDGYLEWLEEYSISDSIPIFLKELVRTKTLSCRENLLHQKKLIDEFRAIVDANDVTTDEIKNYFSENSQPSRCDQLFKRCDYYLFD